MHFLFTFETHLTTPYFLSHFTFFTPLLHLIKNFFAAWAHVSGKFKKKIWKLI
jgi:hypothetical protein